MHDLFIKAVNSFLGESRSLLEYEVYEPAISHRIAFHLERLFENAKLPSLDVDCEYNKHLRGAKTINLKQILKDALDACKCGNCKKILKSRIPPDKEFRPDVVVHRRGLDNLNALVVEIKKSKMCPFDLEKIRALTLDCGEFGYNLGVHVSFRGDGAQYVWFVNGSQAHF
jgi:hypothetical protein